MKRLIIGMCAGAALLASGCQRHSGEGQGGAGKAGESRGVYEEGRHNTEGLGGGGEQGTQQPGMEGGRHQGVEQNQPGGFEQEPGMGSGQQGGEHQTQ